MEEDLVNHPKHYTSGSVECIDAIESMTTTFGFLDYLRGNVMKYLWRANLKGTALQDLKKAQWYLNKLVERVDPMTPTPDDEPNYKLIAERREAQVKNLAERVAVLTEALAAAKRKPAAKKPAHKRKR